MALNFPKNRKEIFDKGAVEFQAELPQSNPTLKNSWLRALLMTIAGFVFEIYERLRSLSKQVYIKTATGDDLVKLLFIWIGNKLSPHQASGGISITGDPTTVVPQNTIFQTNSLQYSTFQEVHINPILQNVNQIEWNNNIATATTAHNHLYASGMEVIILAPLGNPLNGTYIITVTGTNIFTFHTDIPGSGIETDNLQSSCTFATVRITSLEGGSDKNQPAGTQLTTETPITGVGTAYVQCSEIGGGTDMETDEEYRDRGIYRIQHPVANFNVAAITVQIRELSFIKRIFVRPITPSIGQVTIYCLKKNNMLPTAEELDQVKSAVLDILPANTPEHAVHVLAPTPIATPFTFTGLTPNTSTMQAAVRNNLIEFFETVPTVDKNITPIQYNGAIINTVDLQTGDVLSDYVLSYPTEHIIVGNGQIGTLESVQFHIT